jgi:hypothetical protein
VEWLVYPWPAAMGNREAMGRDELLEAVRGEAVTYIPCKLLEHICTIGLMSSFCIQEAEFPNGQSRDHELVHAEEPLTVRSDGCSIPRIGSGS